MDLDLIPRSLILCPALSSLLFIIWCFSACSPLVRHPLVTRVDLSNQSSLTKYTSDRASSFVDHHQSTIAEIRSIDTHRSLLCNPLYSAFDQAGTPRGQDTDHDTLYAKPRSSPRRWIALNIESVEEDLAIPRMISAHAFSQNNSNFRGTTRGFTIIAPVDFSQPPSSSHSLPPACDFVCIPFKSRNTLYLLQVVVAVVRVELLPSSTSSPQSPSSTSCLVAFN